MFQPSEAASHTAVPIVIYNSRNIANDRTCRNDLTDDQSYKFLAVILNPASMVPFIELQILLILLSSIRIEPRQEFHVIPNQTNV